MAHERITQDELDRIGESQEVELKQSFGSRTDAMKALNGMINTDVGEGTVIFGVAPDGTAVGVEGDIDRHQRGLSQHIHTKFDPDIEISIELLECEGKTLIVMRGTRSAGVAYHEYDGRAFIREGSSTRQLNREKKDALARRREGPTGEYVPLDDVSREHAIETLTALRQRSEEVTTVQVWCAVGDANRQRVCQDLVALAAKAGFATEGPTPVTTFSQQPLPPIRLVARSADTHAAGDIANALLGHVEVELKGEINDELPNHNMQVWINGVATFRPSGAVVLS